MCARPSGHFALCLSDHLCTHTKDDVRERGAAVTRYESAFTGKEDVRKGRACASICMYEERDLCIDMQAAAAVCSFVLFPIWYQLIRLLVCGGGARTVGVKKKRSSQLLCIVRLSFGRTSRHENSPAPSSLRVIRLLFRRGACRQSK